MVESYHFISSWFHQKTPWSHASWGSWRLLQGTLDVRSLSSHAQFPAQIIMAQMKGTERRGEVNKDRNEIRWGDMEGRGSSRPGRRGKILFFLMKRKESCLRGGRGWVVFGLFQRYYKLPECSCFLIVSACMLFVWGLFCVSLQITRLNNMQIILDKIHIAVLENTTTTAVRGLCRINPAHYSNNHAIII